MMRNSQWTRDELILALDLYHDSNHMRIRKDDSRIIELSGIINDLLVRLAGSDMQTVRTPDSVGMRLSSFFSLDPERTTKGIGAGSKLAVEVWDEFAGDRDRLRRVADAIKDRVNPTNKACNVESAVDIDESFEAPEGRIIYYEHRARERNPSLVNKKKQLVLKQSGDLKCEVCDFSFKQHYGDIGEGFIECHHNK